MKLAIVELLDMTVHNFWPWKQHKHTKEDGSVAECAVVKLCYVNAPNELSVGQSINKTKGSKLVKQAWVFIDLQSLVELY